VWLPNVKSFSTKASFFNKYKDFEDLFRRGPRVRFGGAYQMKENYIRRGAREGD